MTADRWFEVDRAGFAANLTDEDRSRAVLELVQNGWDADGVTRVDVTLRPVVDVRGRWEVVVTDDAPDGFADLTHAWTLYAPSTKRADATKRGRFNEGEKKILSLCETATVQSTTGSVSFNADGTRTQNRTRRPAGSSFVGRLRMTKPQGEAALRLLFQLIGPAGVTTTINGETLPERHPVRSFEVSLPTVVAGEEGFEERTRRTTVSLFDPVGDEKPMVYEMGLPVVENGDRWHYNVCVSPETRLLTADLRYVPAGEVGLGLSLLGFDEELDGGYRNFRRAEVKHVERIVRPCYRLTFDDGTTVVCSEDHQWLTKRSRSRKWMPTSRMITPQGKRAGSQVVRLLDRWDAANSYEAGYLAAAFDGEGSLTQSPSTNPPGRVNRLTFAQNENVMLDRVLALLRSEGFAVNVQRDERQQSNPRWGDNLRVSLTSKRDVLRFLGRYRPERLLAHFDADLLGWARTGEVVALVKMEYLGPREVVAIETSTRTYVAEGLASHNCQRVPLNRDRDNVRPAYLRLLRTEVANHSHEMLTEEDARSTWVKEALADPRIEPEAVTAIVERRYGPKAVAFDPSDREANDLAAQHGYTVVHGGSMSRGEWETVRRAGLIPAAGQVTPSPKVTTGPDGKPPIPRENWTAGMVVVAEYAAALGKELLGFEPVVEVVRAEIGEAYLAAYGGRRLLLNLTRLGHAWFDRPAQRTVDSLLIHEFAHEWAPNHYSEDFHDATCKLGAALRDCPLRLPST